MNYLTRLCKYLTLLIKNLDKLYSITYKYSNLENKILMVHDSHFKEIINHFFDKIILCKISMYYTEIKL